MNKSQSEKIEAMAEDYSWNYEYGEQIASEHSFIAGAGAEAMAKLVEEREAKFTHALILANDALYNCADQGKTMPGEYDSFLEAYEELGYGSDDGK